MDSNDLLPSKRPKLASGSGSRQVTLTEMFNKASSSMSGLTRSDSQKTESLDSKYVIDLTGNKGQLNNSPL